MSRVRWLWTSWWGGYLAAYSTASVLMAGAWLKTGAGFYFVAFQFLAWPVWMTAVLTDQMWLVSWLPDILWRPR